MLIVAQKSIYVVDAAAHVPTAAHVLAAAVLADILVDLIRVADVLVDLIRIAAPRVGQIQRC